jgi:mRNA interferase MazF
MNAATGGAVPPQTDPQRGDAQRGEVWQVEFDPARGAEIRKTRPAVVMNVPTAGKLPLRVIVPITEWHPAFARAFWHVRIDPTPENGLSKPSSADAFQVRSFSLERFVKWIGQLTPEQMEAIARAAGEVLGCPLPPVTPSNTP